MAGTLNKILLIGHLGADPEIRYTPDNKAVANITLATTEKWRDKTTGESREVTEWHRVVLFGKMAEVAGKYLKKGARVYIEGRIQTEKYHARDNTERFITKVLGRELKLLDSAPGARRQNSTRPAADTPPRSSAPPAPPKEDFDDDIPF